MSDYWHLTADSVRVKNVPLDYMSSVYMAGAVVEYVENSMRIKRYGAK